MGLVLELKAPEDWVDLVQAVVVDGGRSGRAEVALDACEAALTVRASRCCGDVGTHIVPSFSESPREGEEREREPATVLRLLARPDQAATC